MDAPAVGPVSSRRGYWLCLAGLLVALPAALAVKSWGSVREWRAQNLRTAVEVTDGQPVRYAGAEWTFSGLRKLHGGERTIVLAEFEALPDDPAALGQVPCDVQLTDGLGRSWSPHFLTDPIVRKSAPRAAEKRLCGGPTFEETPKGTKAEMAATFVVPASAENLSLTLTMASARPQYLRFSPR
ncbi:hypothetical protein RB623_12445 [Mesorhizobium sp. LHD-90]|uniref:hypothetical protein n=1 Tax=Mesorhizobium sp. LHD-90 TaxID=3071414 RepID=UPI0027E082C2|nr:hypothetical protein [Mesorhizobium sp. LHD-90]MDQ6434858.1 hypothetical protein [Mesorhizobium sp. LHD-90]